MRGTQPVATRRCGGSQCFVRTIYPENVTERRIGGVVEVEHGFVQTAIELQREAQRGASLHNRAAAARHHVDISLAVCCT
jgi:hypothetical protein